MKTTKEKIRKLEKEKERLKSKIKEEEREKREKIRIRNLKIFNKTCNFLYPFVLTSSVTVTSIKLLGGGLPIYKDDVKKYKEYYLFKEPNGYTDAYTSYGMSRREDNIPSHITILTKWSKIDNRYVRYIREYEISKDILKEDLYYAILANDYEYIDNNLVVINEEKIISNDIEDDNNYEYDIYLHFIDKDKVYRFKETSERNINGTITEIIIITIISYIVNKKRDFKYLEELSIIMNEYRSNIKDITYLYESLDKVNYKIKKLKEV